MYGKIKLLQIKNDVKSYSKPWSQPNWCSSPTSVVVVISGYRHWLTLARTPVHCRSTHSPLSSVYGVVPPPHTLPPVWGHKYGVSLVHWQPAPSVQQCSWSENNDQDAVKRNKISFKIFIIVLHRINSNVHSYQTHWPKMSQLREWYEILAFPRLPVQLWSILSNHIRDRPKV